MIKTSLLASKCQSSILQQGMTGALVSLQTRGYLPYYQSKYKKYFKPSYYDNPQRLPQSIGRVKYNTQDPLYFNYRHDYINGGIHVVRFHCITRTDGRHHQGQRQLQAPC
jgi:hypothetical protein